MPKPNPLEIAFALAVALAVALMVALLGSIVMMELQERQERLAVRAALEGDCEGAVAHAARAGRVPYDVRVICSKGR